MRGKSLKMNHKIIFILSLLVFVSSCATYPQSREKQATHDVNKARASISKGNCSDAIIQIDIALLKPTGDEKIRQLFASNQKSEDCYFSHLKEAIAGVSNSYAANSVFEKLTRVKSAKVLSETQTDELFENLREIITEGNRTNKIRFDIGDKIDIFPELQSPEHQQIIVNRSINKLQKDTARDRIVPALMEYVKKVGVNSIEGRRIESLLPSINIHRGELETVAKVFPTFAAARQEEITAHVFMQMKNGDRLLKEDLLEMLRRRVSGVEWVSSVGPKVIKLIVEQVRNNEINLPEQTQTIRYAQYQVNLVGSVLLMPRNASYLYEVVTGGAEIEYGYVVTAINNDKVIYDEVIRGKVNGEYERCKNARIQNVFGGVSPASFVANDDMRVRCGDRSVVSMENLRKEVLSKVVDGILKVPPIKFVHKFQ